jgi:hypothetical protein
MSRPGTLAPRRGVLHGLAARQIEDPRWRHLAPTLAAAVPALAYVLVSPATQDLAAHLFRARLFDVEGFGFWNDWWYSGHNTIGYSLLFPPLAALLTPQLAAGIAATATAALFADLAHRCFGPDAWVGALLFGAATSIDLFTGRLTFAFGALPAMAAVLALDRERAYLAGFLAALSALCSPVAALFCALAAAAYAIGAASSARRLRSASSPLAVAGAAIGPVLALSVVFPERGTEPFAFSALWPIPALAILLLVTAPRERVGLRAGAALYGVGVIVAYLVPSPLGSNAARLGALLAAPLAALLWWRRRTALLAVAALPLLYIGWQAPVSDVLALAGDPSTSAGYYRPLLSWLARQGGQPFRIEIPFTRSHWEAYEVATHDPIARGWERQLDIADNPIFYDGKLSASSYERWLHGSAVRYVAVADAPLDYSAKRETSLIAHGLPYLRTVFADDHWHVYRVLNFTPIVQGAAILRSIGPDYFTLTAQRPGTVLLHVGFSPFWALGQGSGCVTDAGGLTQLSLRRAGAVRLVMRFSLSRIEATSPRCS